MRKKLSSLKSPALHKRKKKILISKIIVISSLILLVFGGIIGVSRLQSLQIATVVVEGNSGVDASSVADVVNAHLKGNYGYMFPRSNKLIYPKKEILQDLIEKFPRILEISAKAKGQDMLISMVERTPSYTWCSGIPTDSMDTKKCYFMDDQGLIFSEAPVFSGNVFFAFYGMVPAEDPVRKTYLNNTEFKNIDTLISFLEDHKLHPYAFRTEDSGTYELYLEQGGKIIFKQGQDIPLLQSNLELVLSNTEIFPQKKQSLATTTLEYIDLRFGNKLFYKQTGDNQVPIDQ